VYEKRLECLGTVVNKICVWVLLLAKMFGSKFIPITGGIAEIQ